MGESTSPFFKQISEILNFHIMNYKQNKTECQWKLDKTSIFWHTFLHSCPCRPCNDIIKNMTNEKKIEIGKRVLQARKELGLTQVEMETRAQISRGYISHVEKGGQNPSFDFLMKLATTFDISIDWLFFGVGMMKIVPNDHYLNHMNAKTLDCLSKLHGFSPEKQTELLHVFNIIMDGWKSS